MYSYLNENNDYQEDIINNKSKRIYKYSPDDGPLFTGAYIAYFEGSLTYKQALDKL